MQSIPFRYYAGNTLFETAYVSLWTARSERGRRGEGEGGRWSDEEAAMGARGVASEREGERQGRRTSWEGRERRAWNEEEGEPERGTRGKRLRPRFVVRILIGPVVCTDEGREGERQGEREREGDS